MIDYRLLTFIDVCETRNLTKTAKHLCLTQPAVTQHIKYLEETYNTKLFVYEGKKMQITESAHALLQYALKNQTFNDIFQSKSYFVAPTNQHLSGFTFYSSMFKLRDQWELDEGEIVGGKTGYTDEAGLCLASEIIIQNPFMYMMLFIYIIN